MDYQELQRRYNELREQFDADKISEEQFKEELEGLQLKDEQGRYWTIGAQSGKWYRYDGRRWLQETPLPMTKHQGRNIPEAVSPEAARREAGLPLVPRWLYTGCAGLGVLVVVAVLIIGAEKLSTIVNWKDRNTCVLFGDGAGAALLQHRPAAHGLLTACMGANGEKGELIYMPAGGSRLPASHETVEKRLHFIFQDGQAVFKYAVRRMYEVCRDLLARNNLKAQDVGVLIPHQANRRIITATADRLGLRPEQVLINIGRYGNTTNATIPLATWEALENGQLKKGDLVLFATVGAGYTVGASLWRWAY